MKKLILSLVVGFGFLFSMSSCVTSLYAQDDVYDGDVDVSVVVSYGTPYYFEGSVLYYLYNGWYYYPYYYNNSYYYYRYSRPLPPPRPGHRFIPRHNERPYFGHHKRHHNRPHIDNRRHMPNGNGGIGHRSHTIPPKNSSGVGRMNNRPSINHGGGSIHQNRPSINRGSRPSVGGGRSLGGHRSYGGRR